MTREDELEQMQNHLHVLQLTVGALSMQIDLLGKCVERLVREGAATTVTAATDHPSPCEHRNKQDISTMGNPGHWFCPECRESGTLI